MDRRTIRLLNLLFWRLQHIEPDYLSCDLDLTRLIEKIETVLQDDRVPDQVWITAREAVIKLKIFNNQTITTIEFLVWAELGSGFPIMGRN